MLLCPVRRPDKRLAFDMDKSLFQSGQPVGFKFFGSGIGCHRQMLFAGLQVLAKCKHFTSCSPQVIHGFQYLLRALAQSGHDARL
jgi:hypothetical protein